MRSTRMSSGTGATSLTEHSDKGGTPSPTTRPLGRPRRHDRPARRFLRSRRRAARRPRAVLGDGLARPLALLDQLDSIAVRVAHEAQPRAAVAHGVGRLLRLDALLGEALEGRVDV